MFKQDQPGKIDKRHGDPDAGGKTSGQKAVSVYVTGRLPNRPEGICLSSWLVDETAYGIR